MKKDHHGDTEYTEKLKRTSKELSFCPLVALRPYSNAGPPAISIFTLLFSVLSVSPWWSLMCKAQTQMEVDVR